MTDDTTRTDTDAPLARDDAPKGDTIYVMTAVSREIPKAPPVFPNPAERPEGKLPPLALDIVSEVPRGVDIAMGRAPQRNAAKFVNAIRSAGDRSIQVSIDDAGGDGDDALAIAVALLQHKFAVSCRIIGRCSSGAAIIALAADRHRRSIVADGSVLIHGARRIFTPEQWENFRRLPLETRQAINGSLNDTDDVFSALLKARLGVSEETARRWMREDKIWGALESFENGFVQAIEDQGTPVEPFRDSYGIMDASEALHGMNCAVECIAEAILKCDFDVDPHIGNVKLLLGFEGADGSTGAPGFTDESPAMHGTFTDAGNGKISTAWARFGSSSYLGENSTIDGSRIQFPDSADWELSPFSSSQFTIEFWIRTATTSPAGKMFIDQYTFNGSGFYFWVNGSSELEFAGHGGSGAWSATSSGLTWTSTQAYAIAVDKDSTGKLRIYRDGVMKASVTPADSSITHWTGALYIGNDQGGSGRAFTGNIDELRITKGVARYASDGGYTVRTTAFPRI